MVASLPFRLEVLVFVGFVLSGELCPSVHTRGLPMAPHLTASELDLIQRLSHQGKLAAAIRERLRVARSHKGMEIPTENNIRNVLAGRTYRKGVFERRGRKKKVTRKRITMLQKARKVLQSPGGHCVKSSVLGAILKSSVLGAIA